jgi:hypothetical protein
VAAYSAEMSDQEMFTGLDGLMLAEAFSLDHRCAALSAGEAVAHLLAPQQRTERFAVQAEGQRVLLPARLHFVSSDLHLIEGSQAWLLARALQTRSNDGFERQRAARDVMANLRPCTTPFIMALMGEYIVEILDDIAVALRPENARMLTTFIDENRPYWNKTKRRIASYWNEYYRSGRGDTRRAFRRDEYIGFKLIERLEMADSVST